MIKQFTEFELIISYGLTKIQRFMCREEKMLSDICMRKTENVKHIVVPKTCFKVALNFNRTAFEDII